MTIFQSIIITSRKNLSGKPALKINWRRNYTPASSVNLLGIDIDGKLNFEKHISNLCIKASGQLIAICRLQSYLESKGKENDDK